MSAARINCTPFHAHAHVHLRTRWSAAGCGLAKMVFTEADYNNVLDYLRLGSYLKVFNKNERRALRRKAECSRVVSGVLYYAGRGRQRATFEGWLRLKRRRRGFLMLVTLQLN